MSDAVIIKRKVNRDFTTLPNDLIRDGRISWGALGLLVYILSLPDDFRLRLCHLSKQKSSGRDATRARAKELEAAGYLVITRERGSQGRYSSTLWEVSDTPELKPSEPTLPPRSDFPYVAQPQTENPNTVLPPTENTTRLNTYTEQERSKKNTTTTKAVVGDLRRTHAELKYPRGTPTGDLPAIAKALSTVPIDDAQALLDELSGALSKPGGIRTTPTRWFFGLLKKYENGQFNSTNKRPTGERQEPNPAPKNLKVISEEALDAAAALKRRNDRRPKY